MSGGSEIGWLSLRLRQLTPISGNKVRDKLVGRLRAGAPTLPTVSVILLVKGFRDNPINNLSHTKDECCKPFSHLTDI